MTKHTNLKLLLLLLIFVITQQACKSQMSEQINMPEVGFNGGFETVSQQLPVNWLVYTPKTVKEGAFTIRFDTADFMEGKQSLVFDVQRCSSKGGWYSPGIAKEWEVQPGATYRVSFKVKSNQSKACITIHAVSIKSSGEKVTAEQTDTQGQWKTLSYEYTVPSGYSRLRIEFNVLSAGMIKLDDVKVEWIQAGG